MNQPMLRRTLTTIIATCLLVFGAAGSAWAADIPAQDIKLIYGPGKSANVVMLTSNLSRAQQANVTRYDIRVRIIGQPDRIMTVKKLPATLYNIIPGTVIHAYLSIEGKGFNADDMHDSGFYTQPQFGETGTVSPAPSDTPTTAPTTEPTQATSPPPTTPAPSITTTSPATQPSSAPTAGSATGDVVTITAAHPTLIIVIASITFLILCVLALLWRRRRGH